MRLTNNSTVRDQAIYYILNSKRLNSAFENKMRYNQENIDDARQELMIEILQMPTIKLEQAYLNGYVDELCVRILFNMMSKTGRYYKKYYKEDDVKILESDTRFQNMSGENKPDDYVVSMDDIFQSNNEEDIDLDIFNERIREIVHENVPVENKVLYELYFLDNYTYKQIANMTNLAYGTVHKKVNQAIKIIKDNLKD